MSAFRRKRQTVEAVVADPRVFTEGTCVRGTPGADPFGEWFDEACCAAALAASGRYEVSEGYDV